MYMDKYVFCSFLLFLKDSTVDSSMIKRTIELSIVQPITLIFSFPQYAFNHESSKWIAIMVLNSMDEKSVNIDRVRFIFSLDRSSVSSRRSLCTIVPRKTNDDRRGGIPEWNRSEK